MSGVHLRKSQKHTRRDAEPSKGSNVRPRKPIDRWLGEVGVAVGLALYVLPRTPAVVVGCLGLIFLLLIHPVWSLWWIEEALWRRIAALGVMLVSLVLIGRVSWPRTELPQGSTILIYGEAYDADYPLGSHVEGILWAKGYSHVHLFVENSSEESVDDLNLSVRLGGVNIEEIRQTGSVPPKCETFQDDRGLHLGTPWVIAKKEDGSTTVLPVSEFKITSSPWYRIHCSNIFAKSAVQFATAVVNEPSAPEPRTIPALLAVEGSFRTGLFPTRIQPYIVNLDLVHYR
jgi:hypothetical protein